MSYKVLARKWRPQHFRDMIGQEPVLRALINALDTDRLHHAYLFTGMRGVGKTTIARIFAKCLNCTANGVSSSPCGECSACRDIEAGRFLDLIEVDAASRTKVDETRELLENVPYAPASGRYKVYLIDEVHMFSTHSFNALLKTLEEPPEHVKFLLATTDPQKVPLTVLSRCLQFNLRRMATGRLADYLATLLDAEGIAHERPALELVAEAAEGSVRDSLSLVEQAAAFGEGSVREGEVAAMLGRVSLTRLLELLETLADGDLPALFARVESLAEYAPDFSQLLGELLSLMHRVALAQSVPDSVSDEASGAARVAALADRVSPEEVQLWYQIGLHARRDLPFAPDPREAFDMALLRMHGFAPQGASLPAPVPLSAASPDVPSAASPSVPPAGQAAGSVPVLLPLPTPGGRFLDATGHAPTGRRAGRRGTTGGRRRSPGGIDGGRPRRGGAGPVGRTRLPLGRRVRCRPVGLCRAGCRRVATPSLAAPGAAAPVGVASGATASSSAGLTAEGWPALVAGMGLSGMPKQLAAHCAFVAHENGTLVLELEAGGEHLNSPRFAERLRTALVAASGTELALDIRVVEAAAPLETPARLDAAREKSALDEARRALDEDPLVQALVAGVDGSLDPASVRPLDPSTDPSIGTSTGERP